MLACFCFEAEAADWIHPLRMIRGMNLAPWFFMRQWALEECAAKSINTRRRYPLLMTLGGPADYVKRSPVTDTSLVGSPNLAGDLLSMPIGHFGITNPLD